MLFRAISLVILMGLFSPALSQRPPEPQSSVHTATASPDKTSSSLQPQPFARLRANANLVLVPVVVTDKSGKHVPGLQKDAFRIEENGKARAVSVFQEVQTEKLTRSSKSNVDEGYSNFGAGDDHALRLTAVVLDMLNTPSMRQVEAKKQLTDYLLRSAARDEPMAIFGLNGSGLHQLHPVTTDTKVLIDALQKLEVSLSSEERTQPPEAFTTDQSEEEQAFDEAQLMSDFMQELDDTLSAGYQRIATRATLVAMTQLARAFQGISGRKTLVWVSAGFPFTIDDPRSFGRQGDDLLPEYEQAWRALNAADIAVYPVDLNTLDFSTKALPSANSRVSSTQVANIRGTNGLKSALRLPYDKDTQQHMTLRAFADATGGQTCVTLEELDTCFAKAINDSRAYYLLGYYLGGDTQPGWRKLRVKVAGDGLHVRHRNGFYVTPGVQDSADLRRQQLVDALASPVQYSGLRLRARLTQASSETATTPRTPADKRTAEFMLEVMGDSLTLVGEKRNAIDLEVFSLALDSNRKSASSDLQAVATELKPDTMQRIQQTSIGIPEKLDLPAGKYEVKFAVRDNASGLIGTVSLPVQLK